MRPIAAWSEPVESVLAALASDPDSGLRTAEAERRLQEVGGNVLREAPRRRAISILVAQFESLLVALLACAAGLSAVFGRWTEAAAILVVLALNAVIGFLTELRAVRSMDALRRLGRVQATVRRDGRTSLIPAEDLVPGDIVVLDAGDVVTADLRLVRSSRLNADESTLTGESLPVEKSAPRVAADAPLAERSSMLYKGTSIGRGAAEAVVVATGMNTELGRISMLVAGAGDETTPLERRLNRLGQRLVWLTLIVAGLIAAAGIGSGKPWLLIVETAIALAVAAVPEGLPVIATITLARGMGRMARRNAVVNRLSAVETLGATSVVLTDKTGTLTENRMTVQGYRLTEGWASLTGDGEALALEGAPVRLEELPNLRQALEVSVLCNNAALAEDGGSGVGDPLEVALLAAAARAGLSRDTLLDSFPEVREVAFDPDEKLMATVHSQSAGAPAPAHRVAVKGAPEAVLAACTRVSTREGPRALSAKARRGWTLACEELAEGGARLLALAEKVVSDANEDVYEGLDLLAVVALADPPRHDVRAAIEGCRRAGIRVVMVTGDHARTAESVARAVGLTARPPRVAAGSEVRRLLDRRSASSLLDADVLARVTPEQKLEIVDRYRREGAIVAMTGDGVNDAPALEKADIGVAMGRRGTQVAREAADVVLKDDAFGTIVEAVKQGRIIFDDIRAFVVYLLSCNLSEILVIGLTTALGAPLPLLPLQILFLNLVTDVFPALALGAGEGAADVLERGPRPPGEEVLTRRHWAVVVGYSILLSGAVLGCFALSLGPLGLSGSQAVTAAFMTLAFGQLWHVFDMREPGSSLFRNEVTKNGWIWGALALCTGLLLVAAFVPGPRRLLSIAPIGAAGWALVLAASVAPTVAAQVGKALGMGRISS